MNHTTIIADSGSTKTTWVFIQDNEIIEETETTGINPSIHSRAMIKKALMEVNNVNQNVPAGRVYFYGAGCTTEKHYFMMQRLLQEKFETPLVFTGSDILGAARALFQDEAGIACILGTGSSSALFDGNIITKQVRSLGFLLGDEGSGNYIARRFLRDYLRGVTPAEINNICQQQEIFSKTLTEEIYKSKMPNKYLASFMPFIREHIDLFYFKNLVRDGFRDFFENQLLLYQELHIMETGFIGSVAYHFSDLLKEVAESKGISVSKIFHSPIQGLIKYHSLKE